MEHILIVVGEEPQNIPLGRKGEKSIKCFDFDCSYLAEKYGAGTAMLVAKRSQDIDAYPIGATQANNIVSWVVSNADTAYVGQGKCELFWYVDNALAKSVVFGTWTEPDIGGVGETPPDPYVEYLEDLEAMIQRVEALETELQTMYERTIYIGDDGNFYVNND